jgi:hypothetical protein
MNNNNSPPPKESSEQTTSVEGLDGAACSPSVSSVDGGEVTLERTFTWGGYVPEGKLFVTFIFRVVGGVVRSPRVKQVRAETATGYTKGAVIFALRDHVNNWMSSYLEGKPY